MSGSRAARAVGFGVVASRLERGRRRIVWRTDRGLLDLGAMVAGAGRGEADLAPYLGAGSLDPLLAAGRAVWSRALAAALRWEVAGADPLPAEESAPVLGFAVADYVDFYASEHHARNVGNLFRPGEPPLPEAWRHLPIGYHGRAGSVVVSGTPVRRPVGQVRNADGAGALAATAKLDLEAELGFVVGTPAPCGRVGLAGLADHVFGVCLVNDWSARDLQAWEYRPLGPFLGKSFATSVSPWLVPLELLDEARVPPPPRDPIPVSYLDDTGGVGPDGLDIRFRVRIDGRLLSTPEARDLYWTGAQQLAHLSVNGAPVRTGDLFASGTISGPRPEQWGSLLELTRDGASPRPTAGGTPRTYLTDGEEVVIDATAPGPGGTLLDLGEVRGRIEPAPTGLA